MSGLEILGGVLACATCVAQVSMNVTSYALQIKHAPQALDEFRQELSNFDELLRQIKDVLINSGREDIVKEDAKSTRKMLDGCTKSLNRMQQEFPAATDEITLKTRILLVVKKDTFATSRAHLQAVSQTLVLFLQKISLAETLNISATQSGINNAASQMLQSQEQTQDEIAKLGSILKDMLKKLTSLETRSRDLDIKSQTLSQAGLDDPELGEIDEVVLETSAGARNIRSYYDAALAFQRAMQERLRSPPDESDRGSINAQIKDWADGVPTEGGSAVEDEAIDVRSPDPSKHSSEPVSSEPCFAIEEEELDENAEHQDPNILGHEIDFFQNQVKRQIAVSAFTDAKKNQRLSIVLSEKLETLHGRPFQDRVAWMLRLAHITMDEGLSKSFEEARSVLNAVKRYVKTENIVMLSELDHFRALTYLEESRSTCADNVRPLPDENAALLLRAERCAIKSLQGRKKLAGPPRDLVRQSVTFLMDLYERTDRPERKYAFGKEYSAFLDAHETPADLPQQAAEEPPLRRPLSVGIDDERSFSAEELWLLQRGFELGPIDFINAPHKDTKITPLITAICANNPDADDIAHRFIRILHADVNRVDSIEDSGISPLMWAVKLKNHESMQILINSRADLSFCDKRGRTLMHYAVEAASTRMLKALFDQKPDLLDRTDNAAQSPLHKAVEMGLQKEVRFLLNRSAAVNAQDKDGQTPLHLAVLTSSEEVARQLLLHKPDPWIKNKDQRTVLEESRKKARNSRLFSMLSEYAAKNSEKSRQRRSTGSTSTGFTEMGRMLSHVSGMTDARADSNDTENKGSKWPHFWKK